MQYKTILIIFGFTVLPQVAPAYDAYAVELANLRQDVMALTEQVGRLQLEVETVQRENASLRHALRAQGPTESHLNALKLELSNNFQLQKQEIFAQVSKQIEQLGNRTQGALDTLARAIGTQKPSVSANVAFSDNYPQEGVAYTVQAGDTLGGIAKKHNSNIKDIQNANRIADPARDLIAGNTIFIPQKNAH